MAIILVGGKVNRSETNTALAVCEPYRLPCNICHILLHDDKHFANVKRQGLGVACELVSSREGISCWPQGLASRVYIRCMADVMRNLILMNHGAFTRAISVVSCMWYHGKSLSIPSPTCYWSYWWQLWAHNNWSDWAERLVTDCPLRGARVASNTEPVLRGSILDERFNRHFKVWFYTNWT